MTHVSRNQQLGYCMLGLHTIKSWKNTPASHHHPHETESEVVHANGQDGVEKANKMRSSKNQGLF